jgi:phosphate-selective porin
MTGTQRSGRYGRQLAAAAFMLLASARGAAAQDSTRPTPTPPTSPAPAPAAKPWYERLTVRGYGQIRYNRLLETNPQLSCEQCDRSWGDLGGVFIRRARVVISGQVHKRVFVYLQPDFSSTAGTTGNVAQIRDWYADLGLDDRNEFRVRIGQSKVPFGYENMQSSQIRLPLDRADATNSAHANERDIGAFVYWAPARVRDRMRTLATDKLKGSGDFGVVALGVFNGQTSNRVEANNGQHVVARVSYPMQIGHQLVEPALAAYTGKYVVTSDQRSTGVKGVRDWNYRDERVVASLSIAPQPFGLLAEWNAGRGPEFNPATDSIETHGLRGGYLTASYRIKHGHQVLFPFMRYQVYDGGKKHERDARSYSVHDVEAGVEWQPAAAFELTAEMYWGDRRFEDFQRQSNTQRGRLLRVQAQFNY